jgi:hypothetical protein
MPTVLPFLFNGDALEATGRPFEGKRDYQTAPNWGESDLPQNALRGGQLVDKLVANLVDNNSQQPLNTLHWRSL